MNRIFLVVLLALGSLTALAFAVPGDSRSSAAATDAQKNLPAQVPDADYVIGPEDVLQVNVWKEPEITSSVPVRSDGKISLALLNDVQAAGLTPMQLASVITERLKQFVSLPRVTVTVTAMNSRRAYVMGQVTRQGAVLLGSNLTVLQALSAAGGPAQFANTKKIYILRTQGGQQQRFAFNYEAVIKGKNPEQNINLKPGDTVVVP